MSDGATGEHAVAHGDGAIAPTEEAMIEELFGPQQQKKGALKRGFKILPRILPYLRPYRGKAIGSILLTILLAVVALAEPWPLAFTVDSIIGNEEAPGWVDGIFGSSIGMLIALAVVATLFLTLLSGVMTVWNEYLTTTVDQKMVLDFRSDMFQHAQKLSLAFHDSESKGLLMYRINNQAAAMGQIVVAIPTVGQSLLTLIGMAYISFTINPLLALLALGTTPFVIYSTTFYTDRIEPRLYRVRGLGAINLSIVYEAMAMMRVVLAFGTQGREYTRFRKQGENWVQETVGLTVRQTLFKIAVQMITAAGTAAVIGVGAYEAVNGRISAGELLVILSYISQVYQPLEELTTTIANFQQWFINLLMSFELMDRKPEVKEKADARPLRDGRGEIELEGVGFGYRGRPGVLKDISLRIPSGRAVAIVGPTGAGKSTLVSLLPRFYDTKEGVVRLDGHDVRDLKLADVREQFSIVLQEPLLFSGSIASNIRYGKPDAPMEEVIEAAKAANSHEFISALPDGYETMLGEGGAKISGGERQRIAVARAFLRDAPILILDEPTSSIDSHTESVILEALDRLMEGRTTILIAHRLSTLRSVDEIVVMNHGEIVQHGTHEDLVDEEGLYKRLWEAQTRAAASKRPRQPVATDPEPQEKPAAAPGGGAAARLEGLEREGIKAFPPAPAPAIVGRSPTPRALPPSAPGQRPKIVLLGMLTRIPVAGVAWLVRQYAVGFERLGYEVYYVEAHSRTPSMFMDHKGDRGAVGKAAAYVRRLADQFGLQGRWAFQDLHGDGRCYGMSAEQLDRLYRDAAMIINMHGGTLPLPEHVATDRLVYLHTDPVDIELEVERGDQRAIEFLDHHVAWFTWGLNYGNPGCELPWASRYPFIPSPPPVVLGFWSNDGPPAPAPFTTIGNWRQRYRDVHHDGRVYRWSKHEQFLRILDLPRRTQARIELALSSYDDHDRLMLAEHGWRVRPALEVSEDLDSYRDYILGSAGEISAAKEQNIHFRTGWFSERSATYLAAGRPVILQDTGFGSALPTGEGLFAFSDLDDAVDAIGEIEADPERQRRAATEIAREYLSHDVVLGRMLEHLGLPAGERRQLPRNSPAPAQLPMELPLHHRSPRRPHGASEDAADAVRDRPIPAVSAAAEGPVASVVLPVLGDLASARLALESILANTESAYELIAVDDGSDDATAEYLEVLSARNRHIRVVRSAPEAGRAAAFNKGLEAAEGEVVVFVNGDVVATLGWLSGLVRHLEDPAIGAVVPATHRSGGDAEYETYGALLRFAFRRRDALEGSAPRDVNVNDVVCAALRRVALEELGPLDERSEARALADYVARVRPAGYRVACAEEVFVHPFGAVESELDEGEPITATALAESERRLEESRRRTADALSEAAHRLEEVEARATEAEERAAGVDRIAVLSDSRDRGDSVELARDVESVVRRHVPSGSTVVVLSDDDEVPEQLNGHETWQFPKLENGDGGADDEAIAMLERLRERGADYLVLPATSLGWLEENKRFRRHLERYSRPSEDPDTAVIYDLAPPADVGVPEERQ
jgi:ATP-binding cassette subfamily B protein